jgi:uncharacterized cupin superfamily protein
MKRVCAVILCCALVLFVFMSKTTKVTAQDATSPVRLDRDKMAGLGLTAIPPDAYKDILVAGQLNMKVATLFSGKELNVSIFECTPAKTDHRTRPNDSDEFVFVLSGKLILTEPDGKVHQFQAGDSLVLPAGYTGTWEMQGNYREIAITAKKTPQPRQP